MDNNNVNPENHENNEEEQKMTYEQYLQGEPNYQSNEMPSTFLSDEDKRPSDVNIIVLPKYDPNYELIIENYLQYASECKNKQDLYNILVELFELGVHHGMVLEKKETLMAQIESLEFETQLLNGDIEIQIIDENEDY